MRDRASDLQIPHSDALTTKPQVSEVEVHMTHVLYIARISNVESVMFVDMSIFTSITLSTLPIDTAAVCRTCVI